MDGFFISVFPNMDLYLSDFATCDIGMKVQEMRQFQVFLFYFLTRYVKNFWYL